MNKSKPSRGPWLWPLALAALGVVLLLNNFLLLGEFNILDLWPLLLVAAGATVLLRGDLLPSSEGSTFGITRGSVESAALEISAGEIDVSVRALEREGRLIAGQYAAQSRPQLSVSDNHTNIRMSRANTAWLSFADWEIGVARDLPWRVLASSALGQIHLDLSNLIIDGAVIASGIGDIRLICPYEAFAPLTVRSSLGNIHIITPPGYCVHITVQQGRFFGLHIDENRYQHDGNVLIARDSMPDAPVVHIHVSGTFGDAYFT